MNAKHLNASDLKNSAKEMIERLATKQTIKAVLTDWNVCVEQSGADFLTFDFPVEGWTRKAQVVAELERVMVQLTNIMEGREALENETLIVCESNTDTQITNALTNEDINMNRVESLVLAEMLNNSIAPTISDEQEEAIKLVIKMVRSNTRSLHRELDETLTEERLDTMGARNVLFLAKVLVGELVPATPDINHPVYQCVAHN